MHIIVILAVLLVVLVGWFLTRPVKEGQAAGEEGMALAYSRDELLKQIRELDQDRHEGRLDETVAIDERKRLEYELAQAVQRLDHLAASGTMGGTLRLRHRVLGIVAITALLAVLAGGLDYWQNRPALITFAHLNAKGRVQGLHGMPPMVLSMVNKLKRHLKYHPDDTNGWIELARANIVLGNMNGARVAYGKAYRLAPDNLDVLTNYAWLLYAANPTQTTGLVDHLYRKLYARDPRQQDALWFLGLAAYHKGHLKVTLRYWTRLQGELPPGSKARAGVEGAIGKVRAQLFGPTVPASPAAPASPVPHA
ncbi:MAG: hypothetical protein M0Z44_01050 [Gammaproteobacteria bacterium]|nr:hypothetical protein [Gammaproteobacteria bacterium]